MTYIIGISNLSKLIGFKPPLPVSTLNPNGERMNLGWGAAIVEFPRFFLILQNCERLKM
jgi:hypothetical protein